MLCKLFVNFSIASMSTFLGSSQQEVIDILNYFDWNWYLAADYFNCDVHLIQSEFQKFQPKFDQSKSSVPYESSSISPEDLKRLQAYVGENLSEPLPLLFDKDITEERKTQIAERIILEKGINFKLTHAQEFKDAYKQLLDEALTLEKWRDQTTYLTILEEALFKISSKLTQENKRK